jgi:hypothetical protein
MHFLNNTFSTDNEDRTTGNNNIDDNNNKNLILSMESIVSYPRRGKKGMHRQQVTAINGRCVEDWVLT